MKYVNQIVCVTILILQIKDTSSQRISAKKCEEYTNLYREESQDFIFNTKEYGELECHPFTPEGTVVGGRDALPYEFPSIVSLIRKDHRDGKPFSFCGGTLISEDFVLTAAHCLTKNKPETIALGEVNLAPSAISTTRRDVGVANVIIHPDYKPPASYNDIALIQLDKKIPLHYGKTPFIRPACLVQSEVRAGTESMAAGWGLTDAYGDTSKNLKVVEIPVVTPGECSDFFRDLIDFNTKFPGVKNKDNWIMPETNICAGYEGKDTCQGDSGGPLFVQGNEKLSCVNYLAGLTSFGAKQCGSAAPGVYTKVSKYLDWIESHVWRPEIVFGDK